MYFLHTLMAHSASNNTLRDLRVIDNPMASLKQPFNFDRPHGDYSVTELTTLHHLGWKNLKGWRIIETRDKIVPERERKEELRRIQEAKPKYLGDRYVVP